MNDQTERVVNLLVRWQAQQINKLIQVLKKNNGSVNHCRAVKCAPDDSSGGMSEQMFWRQIELLIRVHCWKMVK
jgi:hypothetical protein